MKFRLSLLSALFLLVTAVVCVQAEEIDATVIAAHNQFEGDVAAIQKNAEQKRAPLIESYLAFLAQLEKSVRGTGDLDRVLKIKKEREQVAKNGQASSEVSPDFDREQESFVRDLKLIDKRADEKGKIVRETYLAQLKVMEADFTKNDKISSAIAVREERLKLSAPDIQSPIKLVDVPTPTPSDDNSNVKGLKMIVWNTHNGSFKDRGTKTINVEALKAGVTVWKQEGITMDWKPTEDCKVGFVIPDQPDGYDTIRLSITEWIQKSGGFSEIEIYKDGQNIAPQCKMTVSASWGKPFTADQLIDGVTSSAVNFKNYWVLPDQRAGYVDIVLPVEPPVTPPANPN